MPLGENHKALLEPNTSSEMKRTAVIPRQPDILIFRGRWSGLEDDGEMIYSIQGQREEDGSKFLGNFSIKNTRNV